MKVCRSCIGRRKKEAVGEKRMALLPGMVYPELPKHEAWGRWNSAE